MWPIASWCNPVAVSTHSPMIDESLDATRQRLMPALLAHAAFDGWTATAVQHAAAQCDVPADRARLLFPDGSRQMLAACASWGDAALVATVAPEQLTALKIRARVTLCVRARLELLTPHREAVRRAAHLQAMPGQARQVLRQTWATADVIWRLCGDTATDYNHYTKRAILGSVYAATLLYWLNDDSPEQAQTWAFLDRRINGIMQFEKTKARLIAGTENLPSLTRFLGRLRYPA